MITPPSTIMRNIKITENNRGSMLVAVLVAMGLFMTLTVGSISLALLQQKLNIRKVANAQALHVAEAGVNYYRWVLYHDHDDYCNTGAGESCIGGPNYGPYGPYSYADELGTVIGYYELYITPPPTNGSTVVNIKSVGWVADFPNIKRTIEVKCGIPSWSTYATMTDGTDGDLGYGVGSEVWGPIHCNYGCVDFDGIANHIVTSSQAGCGLDFGVNTAADAHWDGNDPPQNLPVPERVNFRGGRDMGSHIPIISFNLLNTEYMNSTYSKATTSGLLIDPRDVGTADPYSLLAYRGCLSAGTCLYGFHVTFKTGNKFDLRTVSPIEANVDGYFSCGILTQSAPIEYNVPDNGIIFIKHTVWVDGQAENGASGTRATILAFKDPIAGNGDADICINSDITYTNNDGTDSFGLIAQRNVIIGAYAEDDLEIHAALLAKTGHRWCPYTLSPIKNRLAIYGATASYLRPQTSGCFTNREYHYDNNLTFSPPPHYPTTGEYTFISWK